MDKFVHGASRHGKINIPSSKSQAHRLLICSALSMICRHGNASIEYKGSDIFVKAVCGEGAWGDAGIKPSNSRSANSNAGAGRAGNCPSIEMIHIVSHGISDDIKATIDCLNEIGKCGSARINICKNNEYVGSSVDSDAGIGDYILHLNCRESGSTLRFLLPVICVLGVQAKFKLEGGLSKRPIKALTRELEKHGAVIDFNGDEIAVTGRIEAGSYEISGDISSQFISGLLFALPLLDGDCVLKITGKFDSSAYVELTEEALENFGIIFEKTNKTYRISGGQCYKARGDFFKNECDWSNAAPFLCMGAISNSGITISGLSLDSKQGDKIILDYLKKFGAMVDISDSGDITVSKYEYGETCHPDCEIDAEVYPDIVPALCILSAGTKGKLTINNTSRLKVKESDRLKNTLELLKIFGVYYDDTDETLTITGDMNLLPPGCEVIDSHGDHRMAMAGALASIIFGIDVVIKDAECVSKSYPDFWNDLDTLYFDEMN